ncbi:MAG: hypothetical protein LBC96_04540 [Lachnospiraceae bacterium]|jgi:hypothetical protein|nr:hypothetical protein [Lachnospiraceae bacterium]
MQVVLLIIIAVFVFSPFLRMLVSNLHNIGLYTVKDVFNYFRYKEWRKFKRFGIDIFIGMFGKGKTLSMTHHATSLYRRYGDSLVFISNYKLNKVPYIPLVNFNQLVNLGETMPEGVQGYVVLIDEISSVLSHRNFANFPIKLIGLLCQQRKRRVYIMCTAQRFFMVDKLWRSITTNVYNCNKHWRFQNMKCYDAWELENAMNASMIRRKSNAWWFVRNRDYHAYDTSEMITKNKSSDFISNEASIVRKGLDSTVNQLAVSTPSRQLKRARKGK